MILVGEGDCAFFGYTPGRSWSHCYDHCIFQVLIKLIKPYTRIKIGFISGELNIDPNDVESLLVSCILDNTIYGRIDQVRYLPESGKFIPRREPLLQQAALLLPYLLF